MEYTISLTALHLREESEGRFAAVSVTSRTDRTIQWGLNGSWGAQSIQVPRGTGSAYRQARGGYRFGDGIHSCEQQANEAIERLPIRDSAVVDVQRVLARRIACGQMDIALVAREPGVSPRTLQRRLAAHGVSYQTLLADTRKEASGRHVSEFKLAICEIAFLLGYSEPAPFQRAFKRWCGVTPQTFRAQQTKTS